MQIRASRPGLPPAPPHTFLVNQLTPEDGTSLSMFVGCLVPLPMQIMDSKGPIMEQLNFSLHCFLLNAVCMF